jgi:streptogramin lyase
MSNKTMLYVRPSISSMILGLLFLAAGLRAPQAAAQPNPGDFLGAFVPAGSGGLNSPEGLVFGPDGHLYVSSATTNAVLRYNGATGAFIDAFVPAQSGGLSAPIGLVFGPDGHLYVSSFGTDAVLRYDGATGAFIDAPTGLVFGFEGDLYVSSFNTNEVLRYVSPIPPSVTRYVAPTGTDAGNDCTVVSNPCATIAYAVAQANGGDIIHLASGVYHESGLFIDKALIVVGRGAVVQ